MSYRIGYWTFPLALVFALAAASPQAGTPIPTLVQHVHGSNTLAIKNPAWIGGPNNIYTIYLANPTRAGNCIIVGMRFDNTRSPSITVSDDKANTYNIGNVTADTTNRNKFAIYYALNVAAGTRKIQVLLASSTAAVNFAVEASEFYNVATVNALDGGSGNFGTNSSITAGSITPSTSGDLIYQIATEATNAFVTYTAGSQTNINWSLLSVDSQALFGAQYGVYQSTAAINPTMSQSSNVNFETSAILLKAAFAGSPPPAGITVNRISHNSLWSTATNGPGYSTSAIMQFPSTGNLLVAAASTGGGSGGGAGGSAVTGITDNNGNVWTACGPGIAASNHTAKIYYAANAKTGSNETLTVNSLNDSSDSTVLLYDISGASSSPCDTSASANGNQTTPVPSLTGPTITPTSSNGVVIGELQQYNGTVVNVTGTNATMLFDTSLYSQENLIGPENVDQNGGWAHCYYTDTSPTTFTWAFVLDNNNTPEDYWTAYAAAFRAASLVPTPPAPPTNLRLLNLK